MKSNLLQSSLAAPYLTAPAFQNLLVPFFSFSPTPAPCRIQIVHKQSSIQPNIHTHPHPLAMLTFLTQLTTSLIALFSIGKQAFKSYDNQPHHHSQLGSQTLERSYLNSGLKTSHKSWPRDKIDTLVVHIHNSFAVSNTCTSLLPSEENILPIELNHLNRTDAKISHHLPIHAAPLQCRMHPPDWSLQWMDCSHRQQ